ncbi:MAG TPA: alpha/beta fold hydrolase [Ktedonobacterales bacterium]|nr:alpha/beta fold hydrolase [Ktedonobacterales bacterium]
MPTEHVNDIQMYYEIHGEGEPLVLIGGLGTDISEWGDLIRWLAQHYRVIAPDNRGAGRTEKPDRPLLKSTTLLTSPKARGKKALPSCTTCREPRRVNAGNRSGVTPPVYDGALIPDIAGKRYA